MNNKQSIINMFMSSKGMSFVPNNMMEEIIPLIVNKINECMKGGPAEGYRWTLEEPADLIVGLNCNTHREDIKKVILDYLEEKHPFAWFKPMFMPEEVQKEFLNTGK